jgi:hypothetical protein
MDFDDEIKKTVKEMEEAEDALAAAGFSTDQWILIKKYIHSAILHNQIVFAKAWTNIPPP